MITDKEALQAARTLQRYCIQYNITCNGCIFAKDEICCNYATPDDWKLPDGIPAAAKEHLMRRFTTII